MVFIQAAISLGAFAGLASAGGIVHMTSAIQPVIDSASTLDGAGSYILENAATGQILTFSREGGTTNFYPGGGSDPIEIQFEGNAARISGGNNKCASAQWSYEVEGGVDHAAVSYACAVGNGQSGTASLEKTKQWWYFIPADESSSSDDGDDDTPAPSSTTTEAPAPSTTTTEAPAPSTTEAAAPAPSSASSEDKVANPSSGRSARVLLSSGSTSSDSTDTSSSSDSNSGLLTKPKGYYETESSTISLDQVDVSSVVKSDRTTWICRHPGWWLNNHPAYVTAAGHVECASDLKAYRAANKRSKRSHHDLAKTLSKRGGQQFYILTQDHIYDMATRAIAGSTLSTYGGYTSTTLSLWDKSDNSQIWTVNSA